jgi:two-component system chemotaxis sensor kinase CheA
MALPEDIVNQFRTVAQQRLERIEQAWAQMLVRIDEDASSSLFREVHTLKGESRLLGFTDINLVCHKLEDLLELARARGYAVDEDFDLTVNMALRFMAMLIRKRVGSQLGGIDLPGFIKQIDQILNQASDGEGARTRMGSMPPMSRGAAPMRVPMALRDRLSPIALDVFIEYTLAKDARRNRLRQSWHSIRELLGLQRAIAGTAQLVKHEAHALDLARDLGKKVDVVFEPGTAEVTSEVLAAIDLATLHLVRNAIDHGIEAPEARAEAGKPARGRITIAVRSSGTDFVLTVADDGRGIQFERVRARAVELGMVTSDAAAELDRERLVELLLQPGFSTRSEATEVSGRGIGLDAVRATVIELGGKIEADSREAGGTTWTVRFPIHKLGVAGHVVRAMNVPFPIVIEESWRLVEGGPAGAAIDIARALGIGSGGTGQVARFERDGRIVSVVCERTPARVQARKLVATPDSALGEIIAIDSVEGVLLRLERLSG